MRKSKHLKGISLLIPVLLAGFLCLTSCSKTYKDIELKDVSVEKLSMSSIRSFDATLVVVIDNPAVQRFNAENVSGTVYQNGVKVASFSSNDMLLLEPKSLSENKIKVRVALENASALISQFADNMSLDMKDFTVDFQATVSSGILKFPYSKKGVKIDTVLKDDPFKDF